MEFKFGMDLITQRLMLKDIDPSRAKSIADQFNLKEDEVQFIRKGIVPSDLQFEDGERAVISYITTGAKDRDREIVVPKGAMLEDYRKNPVVLFCHDYRQLPIGKNIWIKSDDKGLIAKTVYAPHEEAEKVYQYRKAGFPLAESIGFVPLEWTDHNETEREKNGGVNRTFTKWLLLEYSDVPVPSNPEALMIAVSKGLIKTRVEEVLTEVEFSENLIMTCPYCKNVIKDGEIVNDGIYSYHEPCKDAGIITFKETVEKPGWDETDAQFRYRVREPSLFQDGSFRTVPIKRDKPRVSAVMGKLKNEDTMTIQNLMFPKEDEWTLATAKSWLAAHKELLKDGIINLIRRDAEEIEIYYLGEIVKLTGELKSGRVLSTKNRELIATALSGMKAASDALDGLLAATEEPPKEEELFDFEDPNLSITEKDILESFSIRNSEEVSLDIDIDDLISKAAGAVGKIDFDELIGIAKKKLQGKVI